MIERRPVVHMLAPAADAAGRTSVYVSVKNMVGPFDLVCYLDQGNAAQVTLTPLQASAVAGTGSKAIVAVPIWANEDAVATDAYTRQTDAVNFQTSAAVKKKIVVFQIDPAKLDIENGFDCIAIQTSASNAANITSAHLSYDPSYKRANPPSVLVD